MNEPMTRAESEAWHPELDGWSDDILPFYRRVAEELPDGAWCAEIGVFHTRSLRFLASEGVRLGKLGLRLYGVDLSPLDVSQWAPVAADTRADDWGTLLTNLCAAPAAERQLIHTVRATSVQAARMFDAWALYVAFIDGTHTKPAVTEDLAAWMPKVKPGGLLCGHDYGAAEGVTAAVDGAIPRAQLVVEGTVWSWRVR